MREKSSFTRVVLVFFICVAINGAVSAFPSSPQISNRGVVRHFILPIWLEGRITPSPLNISLRTQEYNRPVSDFLKNTEPGAAEQALARLVRAIRTGDRETFKSLTVKENHAHVEQLMKMYAPAFEGIPQPVLLRRFDVGGIAVLVVKIGKEGAPTASFPFRKENGVALLSASSLSHPILQNVLRLSMELATDAPKYTLSTPGNSKAKVHFDDLFGDSGENPVSIYFSGIPMVYPMMTKKLESRGAPRKVLPALTALEDSLTALREGAFKQHLDTFSEKSRERVQEVVNSTSKARLDWYQKSSTQFRQINYVLHGRGIHILFYQFLRGKYRETAINYEIMETDKQKRIKRANYNAMGPVHNLLHWPKFFKKMIRDVINTRGTVSP